MYSSKTMTIIWSTLIVGILDAIAAIIAYGFFYKYTPVQIYQFVASALLGNEAYAGGTAIALLGLAFHFLIAFVCSYLFIQLYPTLRILRQQAIITGLIYGIAIWIVMNLIILPITKIPASAFDIVSVLSILWHMLLVGLPISLIAKRYYRTRMTAGLPVVK